MIALGAVLSILPKDRALKVAPRAIKAEMNLVFAAYVAAEAERAHEDALAQLSREVP
jgi:hypothetical protein